MKRCGMLALAVVAGLLVQPGRADSFLKDRETASRAELATDPTDIVKIKTAMMATINAGDVEKAIPLARRLLTVEADPRAARLVLTVVAMKANDFREASNQLANNKGGPQAAIITAWLDVWCAVGEGRTDEAQAKITAVRAKFAEVGSVMAFHAGLVADLAGDAAKAEDFYRQSLQQDVTVRVVDAYGRLLERQGRAGDAAALYEKYRSDPLLAAVSDAGLKRIAAKQTPDRLVPSARDGMAEAMYSTGASLHSPEAADAAIMFSQLALYLRPDFDAAKALLVEREKLSRNWELCRAKTDDTIAACTILLDQPKLSATMLANIHGERSIAYSNKGDFAAALADLDQAITANPRDGKHFNGRGSIYMQQLQFERAIADFDQAIMLMPSAAEPFNNRGLAYMDIGNLEAALQDFNRSLSISPNNYVAHANRGVVYTKLGDYGQAKKDFDQAIELKSDFAPAYNGRARLKDAMGDVEGAKADHAKAKSLDPSIDQKPFTPVLAP